MESLSGSHVVNLIFVCFIYEHLKIDIMNFRALSKCVWKVNFYRYSLNLLCLSLLFLSIQDRGLAPTE